MFMGEAGREMVGKYAEDVTNYYCMASELDNHCVRESACHSIAEMAEKVWYCSVSASSTLHTKIGSCRADRSNSWGMTDAECRVYGLQQ